jgi:hypothetical protein
MIVLPAGCLHRFSPDAGDRVDATRLFVGEPVWTPIARGQPAVNFRFYDHNITTLSPTTANLTAAAWWAGYGRFGVRAMWLDETEPDRTSTANEGLGRGEWEYEGGQANEPVRGTIAGRERNETKRNFKEGTNKNVFGAQNSSLLVRKVTLRRLYQPAPNVADTGKGAFSKQIPLLSRKLPHDQRGNHGCKEYVAFDNF